MSSQKSVKITFDLSSATDKAIMKEFEKLINMFKGTEYEKEVSESDIIKIMIQGNGKSLTNKVRGLVRKSLSPQKEFKAILKGYNIKKREGNPDHKDLDIITFSSTVYPEFHNKKKIKEEFISLALTSKKSTESEKRVGE